jgi:ribosomal protein L37AE/L43A
MYLIYRTIWYIESNYLNLCIGFKNMKTHLCEIVNKWNWSIETAGIWVSSPSGNAIRIRKLDCDLIPDACWTHIESIVSMPDGKRELTVEQMYSLSEAVKAGAGELIRARKVGAGGSGVAAPQKKVPQQKSYVQRNAERLNRIADQQREILHGRCPSCNLLRLKVKNHGTWAGYFCSKCQKGGSMTLQNKFGNYKR